MRLISSPLNYTGGKARLLPQILPLFPQGIRTFVDLFAGGCNVGLNVDAETVVYNDNNKRLIEMFEYFKTNDMFSILGKVYEIIREYGLSQSSDWGYDHYGCDSGSGLASYNKERFLRLRGDYNAKLAEGVSDPCMLYVLIVYSFNNQIRFNSCGHFNLPVGKRDFNNRMESKLYAFIDRIQSQNCVLSCGDFREFDISGLGGSDFVYCDPPYLITSATYNEQGGWDARMESDLLEFLDRLDGQNVRFALSNVLAARGRTNDILRRWIEEGKSDVRVVDLDCDYSNSNYHIKDKEASTREVLVVNY